MVLGVPLLWSPFRRVLWRGLAALLIALLAATGSVAASSDKEAAPEGPQVVKMNPIRVPVFRNGALTGEITVGLNLAIADGGDLPRVNQQLPRFEAAALNYLLRYANALGDNRNLLPLASFLDRFQKMWDPLVGKSVVKVLVYTATYLGKS
ncbi:MAG: hypothetical protein FJX56_00230 [Alphaproteobacteria bacterium]|nr:hypothetical protein [Alphaproteobacteria bacterium]